MGVKQPVLRLGEIFLNIINLKRYVYSFFYKLFAKVFHLSTHQPV